MCTLLILTYLTVLMISMMCCILYFQSDPGSQCEPDKTIVVSLMSPVCQKPRRIWLHSKHGATFDTQTSINKIFSGFKDKILFGC